MLTPRSNIIAQPRNILTIDHRFPACQNKDRGWEVRRGGGWKVMFTGIAPTRASLPTKSPGKSPVLSPVEIGKSTGEEYACAGMGKNGIELRKSAEEIEAGNMGEAAPMRPGDVVAGYTVPVRKMLHEIGADGIRRPIGYAERKGYSQEKHNSPRLEKVGYSHDALIDAIIANPRVTQKELAGQFGYSTGWLSRIIGSDAFQAALAERRAEIADPFLIATMKERLEGLAAQSIDVIAEKLASTNSADIALKALDISSKALGFGARDRSQGTVHNQFVVQLPPKAGDADVWAEAHRPAAKIIESQPFSSTVSRDPLEQPREMKTAGDSE